VVQHPVHVSDGHTHLADAFDLERIEVGLFRATCRQPSLPRAFGGEVAAQALGAAGRTVPGDRPVHSLHAYFVRPGDPGRPILHRVDPVRDGGSFTTRRVTALQDGEAVLVLAASFQRAGNGPRHQLSSVDPPDPDQLPTATDVTTGLSRETRDWYAALAARIPLELRFDGKPPDVAARTTPGAPSRGFWLRSERLGPDPVLHACVLTYASDLLLLSSAMLTHGVPLASTELQHASLDHSVWFHAPARPDEWLYYEQESPWAGGGRALCRGSFFDRSGSLVASVTQEGLVRYRDEA
jgi:acyl-CoA thioesterase-2